MVLKPTPAAASGIASIPAPMVVPATIKILPIVRFLTLSSALLLQGVISWQRTGKITFVKLALHYM
ncbi:hypothetical protein O0544_15190 [Edwardsiella anguillarum]|nr:hypothetical protein [Edwardsiella anguillarum]